jgi:RNA polymerase sigma-70 factor (ECF subfamily)
LNPAPDLATKELVDRASRGCRDSFGILAERHAKGVYNFLLHRARSHEDAEELSQETFLRAWRKLGTYRDDWRFSTWLYAVARSVAADRARAAAIHTTDADLSTHAGSEDHAREIGRRDEGDNLWRTAREVLDDDQHTAMWLFYAEDRSAAEIGRILGRTALAVRVLMFRARSRLGQHIERRRAREGTAHAAPLRARMETTR